MYCKPSNLSACLDARPAACSMQPLPCLGLDQSLAGWLTGRGLGGEGVGGPSRANNGWALRDYVRLIEFSLQVSNPIHRARIDWCLFCLGTSAPASRGGRVELWTSCRALFVLKGGGGEGEDSSFFDLEPLKLPASVATRETRPPSGQGNGQGASRRRSV